MVVKISFLSEFDAIESWMTTVENYHVGTDYGNNFKEFFFKNTQEVRRLANSIYDKIQNDLSKEVVDTISEVGILDITDEDKFAIVIRYNGDMFALAKIERVD